MRGLLECCKAVPTLSGEPSVEISVAANPNPNPRVVLNSLRDSAVVPRNADRPEARVRAHPLKLREKDEQDPVEIFGKRCGQRYALRHVAPSKASRSPLFLWKSRTLLKVAIFDFGELCGPGFELSLYLITES